MGGYLSGNSFGTSISQPQNGKNTSQPQVNQPQANRISPDSLSENSTGPPAKTATQTATPENQDPQEAKKSNSKEEEQGSAAIKQLTQEEFKLLDELKQADTKVRNHEMAHVAAGGGLITSGASFTYRRGPDGLKYAVAGEVGIDTSAIPGDPKATIQKMQQVKRAALAPASPSNQDIKVAANASSMAAKASSELTLLIAKEQAASRETQAFGNLKQASDSYIKVNNLPEGDNSTFKLAV